MKKLITTLFVAVLATTIGLPEAEAKRLGGGRSTGMQRDTVTQKQSPPPAASAAAPAAAGAAAAAPKRSWMGPIAGLAAGLGLAALFSHLGLGEGMANFVMIMLLVLAAVFVFRLIFKRPATPAAQPDTAMQYAGVGGPGMAPPPRLDTIPGSGVANPVPGIGAAPAATPVLPADFDAAGFVRVAKVQFVRMQAAHDAGNLDDIREFTTPEMFAEIKLDIDERKGAQQQTEVLNVDAEVLEVATEATRYVASVRFRGMIREEKGAPESAFDEVWNLVKPIQGGGWLLA
ncbi:MAG TPA: Tim44-like domain-containing protein, partial [Rhodocyclaceae bacterium]|nr:Tim44-like domain-containing protein [Rhodocyclaceae bacterium]